MATVIEAKEAVQTYQARYRIDLMDMSIEALREQHAELTAALSAATSAAEQATKFRPGYAKSETRKEREARTAVRLLETERHETHMAINLKAAGY